MADRWNGLTNPFDFDDEPRPVSGAIAPSAEPASVYASPVLPQRHRPTEVATIHPDGSVAVARPGQGLAWVSLVLAAGSAAALGLGLYEAIATVGPSSQELAESRGWMTIALVGCCGLVLTFAGSIVALVRSRPKVVATFALVATVALPTLASMIAVKFGIDALTERLSATARAFGKTAGSALQNDLTEHGVNIVSLLHLLFSLLG